MSSDRINLASLQQLVEQWRRRNQLNERRCADELQDVVDALRRVPPPQPPDAPCRPSSAESGGGRYPTPEECAQQVEAIIAQETRIGKTPSRTGAAMMRGWSERMREGELHPWYGPCDGMGVDNGCSECQRFGGGDASGRPLETPAASDTSATAPASPDVFTNRVAPSGEDSGRLPPAPTDPQDEENDFTRVDGVPSDRPLGSTASRNEVK